MKNIKSSNGLTHQEHEGIGLVCWYLQLVNRLRPTYWTFEQVVHPQLIGALRAFTALCPGLGAFNCYNFSDYGLAQTRIRILAGTPVLIDNMSNNEELREQAPSVKEVLAASIPPDAFYINSALNKLPDASKTVHHTDGSTSNPTQFRPARTVDEPCYTCTAYNPHMFLAKDYSLLRTMTPMETAALQSFPPTYRFPSNLPTQVRQIGAGNALPPLIARKLLSGVQ